MINKVLKEIVNNDITVSIIRVQESYIYKGTINRDREAIVNNIHKLSI